MSAEKTMTSKKNYLVKSTDRTCRIGLDIYMKHIIQMNHYIKVNKMLKSMYLCNPFILTEIPVNSFIIFPPLINLFILVFYFCTTIPVKPLLFRWGNMP